MVWLLKAWSAGNGCIDYGITPVASKQGSTVQDLDVDDEGEPETLRLLFGTSRRRLEDGKCILVELAPTAFGPVSVREALCWGARSPRG